MTGPYQASSRFSRHPIGVGVGAGVRVRVGLRADSRRWDRKLFPDHVGFLKGLHDKNLKTTLNTHPADGVRAFEEQYPAMCKALGRDPSTKLVSVIGHYRTVPVPCHPGFWESAWTLPTPPSEPLPCPSTASVESTGTSRTGLLPAPRPIGTSRTRVESPNTSRLNRR